MQIQNYHQKLVKKGQKSAKIAHFSNIKFCPKLLTRQQFFHVFGKNNRETLKNCPFLDFKISAIFQAFYSKTKTLALAAFSILFCGILLSAITSVSVLAETKTGVSVEVVNGCSVSVTNSEHNAEISAGTYVESIGDPTVFQIACNDTNRYTINAVGYSNDIEGTTELISTSDNGNITTGTQQSGAVSNWSFHLLENSSGVTIADTFDRPHEIPGSGTVIAKRDSGFKNPGDTGFDIFKVAYSAYISTLQPAGAYKGKVKYTLYNQGIAYSYKITYNLNNGDSGPQPQTGEVMDLNIKLSAEESKRDGYDFVAWCSVDPKDAETCSGQSYAPGADYTLPGNNATIDLYATWKKSKPQYGEVCNADQTGKVMKDGKCWSSSDVSSSSNWSNASTLCSDKGNGWHLPSQAEFNTIIRTYYPTASVSGTGYFYRSSGGASQFTNDWGATYGLWWSSTIYPSSPSYAFLLYLDSSDINSSSSRTKTSNYQVRCVSEV